MKTLITSLLLFLLPIAHAAEKSLTIQVKPADSSFQISLPSNPTIGYQWTLKQYDKTLLTLSSQRFISPKSGLIGAGGYSVFVFQLIKNAPRPTSTQIQLSYERPWEKKPGTLETVTVNFEKIS